MENENTANALNENIVTQPTRWQRFKLKLLRWWLFNFRNNTVWRGEIGGFRYRMRKYWLDIRSIAPNHWNLRIGIANHAYGFLLAVINEMQKTTDEAERKRLEYHFTYFATNLYYTSAYLLQDVKFAKGLNKELEWAYNRLIKKAKEESGKVTKEQEDSEQVFMEDAVNRGNMNRQQRRKAEREARKSMKEEIKNDPIFKGAENI